MAWTIAVITAKKNYFEVFLSDSYGYCLRFNSGKNFTNHSVPILQSKIGGVDDSLSIKFDRSHDMAIWVHNVTSPPTLELKSSHYSNRVFVSSNSYTEITIEKVIEVKLKEPYNDCLDDVTTFKYNKTIIDYYVRNNLTYTQDKCLELYFEIDYIDTNPCNCTSLKLGNV